MSAMPELHRPWSCADGHPAIDALLARAPSAMAGADRAIHPADEMLGHALAVRDGDLDAALVDYFREGLQVASAVRQVATWRWGGPQHIGAMLDFASGCGRVTRFLVREIPAERITVSDVLADAIAFQAERFGVRAVVSAADPAGFEPPERYDLIWATSLFTHLPAAAFEAWLGRLLRCLAPGGLLVFSVHDSSVLRPEETMPAGGFLFRPHSESRTLDPATYGSSFATQAFVRAAVERAGGAWCDRQPRALSNFQDVYLVAAESPPRGAPRMDAGPLGHLDRCVLLAPGALELAGWAAQWTGGEEAELGEVVARLDGVEIGAVRAFAPRPDVDAAHRRPGARGFALRCALPAAVRWDSAILEVAATSSTGFTTPLYLGSLRAAYAASLAAQVDALRASLAEREGWFAHVEAALETMVAEREGRIEAMRRSRFWRARTAWFRLKRRLGMTSEA